MKKLIIVHLIFIVAMTGNSLAQDGQISKEQIIDNAWKSMFADIKKTDIKSIYVERYAGSNETPAVIMLKRPNLIRNEYGDGTLIFDGKRVAEIDRKPDENGKTQASQILDANHWQHFEVDIALLFPALFDHPSFLKGVRKVGDVKAYEFFVPLPMGGDISYFVDIENFLIIKRVARWEGNPVHRDFESEITDYINYDGIRYPAGYIHITRDGHELIDLYKNVKINDHLDPELYEIPVGIE